MADFDEYAGELVQRARLAKGMSQADLASAMTARGHPMHQQTVLKIEKGARAVKLSEALDLTVLLDLRVEDFRPDDELMRLERELVAALKAAKGADVAVDVAHARAVQARAEVRRLERAIDEARARLKVDAVPEHDGQD